MNTIRLVATSLVAAVAISSTGLSAAPVSQARRAMTCCAQAPQRSDTPPAVTIEKRSQRARSGACGIIDRSDKGKCQGQGKGKGQCKGKGKGGGNGQGQGKGKGQGKGGGNGQGQGAPLVLNASAPASAAYVQRLQSVLNDEFRARDVYASADRIHSARRYQNLARAEQRHANAIAAAIRALGGEPVLAEARAVDAPATMVEADKSCEEIELHVIKVYTGLIEDCPDPALLPMLKNIQAANRRHLSVVAR